MNRFRFGGPGNVYGTNVDLKFDIRIKSVPGVPDLICTGIAWAPVASTRPSGAPTNSNWGVQSLGTCQFADPGVAVTTCPLLFPPNVLEDQYYGYSSCAQGTCDSSPKNKVSGPFLLEWRDWGSFGFSPAPIYGTTAGCFSGSCVDSTVNTNWARTKPQSLFSILKEKKHRLQFRLVRSTVGISL